eukprot:55713-Prorocentrum_minimum.AAC.1
MVALLRPTEGAHPQTVHRMVGLHAVFKPLIRPFTTGEFNSPPRFSPSADGAPHGRAPHGH